MPAPKKNVVVKISKYLNKAVAKSDAKLSNGTFAKPAAKKLKKVKPELKKPLTTPKPNVKVKDSTSRDPFAGMNKPMGPLTPKQQEAQRLRASQIRMDRMRAAEAKAKKNR